MPSTKVMSYWICLCKFLFLSNYSSHFFKRIPYLFIIGLNKFFKLITFFTRVSNVFIQVWKHVWINRITFSIIFHYCLIFCTHWKSLVRFVSFSSKYRSTLKRLQLTIESRMKMKFVINSWTNLVPRRNCT